MQQEYLSMLVRIPAQETGWSICNINLSQNLYCWSEKTENKIKKGRDWPIFKSILLHSCYFSFINLWTILQTPPQSQLVNMTVES